MANEAVVTLKIGASIASSVTPVFAGLKRQVGGVQAAVGSLKREQKALRQEIVSGLGQRAGSTLVRMKQQYEDIGRAIDQLHIKQAKLQTLMAHGENLAKERGRIKSELMDTAGTATVITAPLVKAFREQMQFSAQLRDTAMTGGMNRAQEAQLGKSIRANAVAYGQDVSEIGAGVNQLVREGMGDQAAQYVKSLSKISTALGAPVDELARGVYTLDQSLGVRGEKEQTRAWGMLGYGASQGTVNMHEMVPALRQLAPSFANLGIKGDDALQQIAASLEVGAKGAGTPEEAVTNMRNWMSHMTSQQMTRAYAMQGVDYQQSMKNLVAGGQSPYEASLAIAEHFAKQRGGADIAAKWRAAGNADKTNGNNEQQQALMQRFGLSSVISDMQTMNHLVAMIQFKDEYKGIKDRMGTAGSSYVDKQLSQRQDTDAFRVAQLKASLTDTAISLGSAIASAAQEALRAIKPLIGQFKSFVEANPALIRGVTKLALGFLGLKAGGLAVRWLGNFFVATPWNTVSTLITGAALRLNLLRVALGSGGGKLVAFLQLFGATAKQASVLAPIIGRVGAMIGGTLMRGLRLAISGVTLLGRALMLNPIGLAITAIAVGAYLLYRYWTPISGFFKRLWTTVSSAFSDGIAAVSGWIKSWHPVDTFMAAMSAVWTWLGGLKDRFVAFGGQMIDGLIAGIEAKFTALKQTISDMGQGVSDWFKDKLDIHSPSRVFQGHGQNVVEGAVAGITQGQGALRKAALGMAASTAVALAPPSIAGPSADAYAATGGSTTFQVTFAPQITIQGATDSAIEQRIQRALREAFADFQKQLQQAELRARRRSFADDGGV